MELIKEIFIEEDFDWNSKGREESGQSPRELQARVLLGLGRRADGASKSGDDGIYKKFF